MALNPFFNNFNYTGEQRLLNDLTVETIRAMGQDVIYIPREYLNIDEIFGEDTKSRFSNGYILEMYPVETLKFGGSKDVMTKFGIAITSRVTLEFAKTRFFQEISTKQPEITRPREGDLVYMPIPGLLFEINYVNDEEPFYQFGLLTTFQITCELFTYSHEEINTGFTEIDEVFEKRTDYATIIGLTGNSMTGITLFQGGEIIRQGDATATVVETITNNRGKATDVYLTNITGSFVAGATLMGVESGAVYTAASVQETIINIPQDPFTEKAMHNNDVIQKQSYTIQFSSDNPFSENC
jgi:hypothetical protein